MTDRPLRERSSEFAGAIAGTLGAVLPVSVGMVSLAADEESRYVVRPAGDTVRAQRVPLHVGGVHLADMALSFYLALDREGLHLKVQKSTFAVYSVLDRTPIVRLEYDAAMTRVPAAHWHIHAERGAFSHLLARAHAVGAGHVTRPHELSSLHFPVGGERFRPCLEDFLEFLVSECGVDARSGWDGAVRRGRSDWRKRQLRALTRDAQQEAAETLTALGWTVTPPPTAPDVYDDTFVKP